MNGIGWDAEDAVLTRQAHILALYRSQLKTVPCACGGRITARPDTDAVIRAAETHQRTPRHRQWFRASGWTDGGATE